MKKHYFETSDLWDEQILGVIEDALQCSPFLTDEQRAQMITLLYSRFYEAKEGNKVNMPFEYKVPSTEQVYAARAAITKAAEN